MTVDGDDPLVSLSAKQESALEVLLRGGTQKEAAEAASVARETVCRWVNDHPGFIAALNQGRQARVVAMRDRVQEMDAKALAILDHALEDGDPGAALAWLRMRSVRGVGFESPGPMSADEVIDTRAQSRVDEVRQEFIDMLAELNDEGSGIPSVDRYAVRETVANELRERLGLSRVPTSQDAMVHWSAEEHVPCGQVLVAADDDTALALAQELVESGGSDGAADVSPLCTWDLGLLLDDLRSGVEIPNAEGIQGDDDPFELDRLDARVVAALAQVSDADLQRVPRVWATNPDLESNFTEVEAERILRKLRDTARSVTKNAGMYLWTAVRYAADNGEGLDVSPPDDV